MKGAYVLLMHIGWPVTARTGSLSRLHFGKGVYAYVGSALNGLEPRISRHLSKRKEGEHALAHRLPDKLSLRLYRICDNGRDE